MGAGAGDRDRRIILQRPAKRENAMGEAETYWVDHCRAWARYQPGSGAERREAAQEGASLPATFTTLWTDRLAAVTTDYRILFGNQPYDIKSAVELGAREGLQFIAVTQFQGA